MKTIFETHSPGVAHSIAERFGKHFEVEAEVHEHGEEYRVLVPESIDKTLAATWLAGFEAGDRASRGVL